MKMGVKEFRARLGELAAAPEPVIVTSHGREVGTFIPSQWVRDAVAAEKAAASVARWRKEMKARGIDLEAELAAMGLSPLGEPLDVQAGR